MLLSLVKDFNLDVRRDGDFQNLGFHMEHRPSMLSFLESGRFLPGFLRNKSISAVLTTPELADEIPEHIAVGISKQPRIAFAELHNYLTSTSFYYEDFPTVIDANAEIHPRAWIAERNVTIGPQTKIGPNATILERSAVGARVAIGLARCSAELAFKPYGAAVRC